MRLSLHVRNVSLRVVFALGVVGAVMFAVARIPAILGAPFVDYDSTRTQLSAVGFAVTEFARDMGRLPTTDEGLAVLSGPPVGTSANWHGPYVTGGQAAFADHWGHPIMYRASASGREDMDIRSLGRDGRVGSADDITLDLVPSVRALYSADALSQVRVVWEVVCATAPIAILLLLGVSVVGYRTITQRWRRVPQAPARMTPSG